MTKHARKSKQKKTILLFTTCIAVMVLCGVVVLLQTGGADAWQSRVYRLLTFWENRVEEPEDANTPDEEEIPNGPDSETAADNEPIVPPAPEDSEPVVPELPKPTRIAYLTFDDGPSVNTPRVLDILAEYDIKATFFVIGHDNEFAHSMYRRIVQEGHAIGNHTFSHDYSRIYTSQANFLKDFYRLEDLLDRVIGIRPRIMRFPGGSNNQTNYVSGGSGFMKGLTKRMRSEGYTYYDWNVSAEDSVTRTSPTADIVQAVKSRVSNKSQVMVLFHDSAAKTTTVEALPTIIEFLQKEGFAFRAIDQDTPGFRFQ